MSSLEQMYQQVILDHAKRPHGKGLVDVADGHAHGESHQVNPTCGDEVTMRVEVADVVPADGGAAVPTITGVSWDGQGCSISQASISVLHDLVVGQPMTEGERLGVLFRDLMGSRGKGLDEEVEDDLGDATVFTGVSQYPARIKCALLGWAALRDSLVLTGVPITSDSTPSDSTIKEQS